MNITLHIKLFDAETPDTPHLKKNAGDIVKIYDTDTIATWNGTEFKLNEPIGGDRLGFLHVKDFPDTWTILQLNQFICGVLPDPDDTNEIVRWRKFRFDTQGLPVPILNKIQNEKEFTITWKAQYSERLKKIIIDPTDKFNLTKDTVIEMDETNIDDD